MGVITLSAIPNTGAPTATLKHAYLPEFTGNLNWSISLSSPMGSGAYTFPGIRFKRSSDGMICWTDTQAIGPGQSAAGPDNWTVGSPGAVWHCSDWDTVEVFIAGPGSAPPVLYTWQLNIPVDVDVICAYGTQLKPLVTGEIIITEGALAALALAFPALGWLSLSLATLTNLAIQGNVVCNGPPPDMPAFDSSDFLAGTQLINPASYGKIVQAYIALNWGAWCECLPAPFGSPDPVPYVVPDVPTKPPSVPDSPTPIVCSPGDPCSTFNQVINIMTTLAVQTQYNNQQTINNIENLVQNIAYDLSSSVTTIGDSVTNIDNSVTNIGGVLGTEAYELGSSHTVSGAGQFATAAGILGLVVQVSGTTTAMGVSPSEPLAYYTECHVAFGTPEGFFERKPLRHLSQVLQAPPWCTVIGYHTVGDLSLEITELVPVAP